MTNSLLSIISAISARLIGAVRRRELSPSPSPQTTLDQPENSCDSRASCDSCGRYLPGLWRVTASLILCVFSFSAFGGAAIPRAPEATPPAQKAPIVPKSASPYPSAVSEQSATPAPARMASERADVAGPPPIQTIAYRRLIQ